MEEYLCYSEEAKCPNSENHVAAEGLQVIGNSTYKCACGCQFEWYSEDSYCILKHGYVKADSSARQAELESKDKKMSWTILFVAAYVFFLISLMEFFVIIMLLERY